MRRELGGVTRTVSQPAFSPGLSVLAGLRRAAIVMLRDDLPFDPEGTLHRARLRSPGGDTWLTLPVQVASPGAPSSAIGLDPPEDWAPRALRTLEHAYESAPFFEHHRCDLARILFHRHASLGALVATMLRFLMRAYDLPGAVVLASECPLPLPEATVEPDRGHRHRFVSDASALDVLLWRGPQARALLHPTTPSHTAGAPSARLPRVAHPGFDA